MLLQSMVSDPKVQSIKWLDLACGQGQILMGLDDGFSVISKKKIEFTGYDLSDDYVKATEKLASSSGLRAYCGVVGDLADVDKLLDTKQFDFITLTNTVHEIRPRKLAGILVDAILRLSPSGILFIYDMETIDPPELGAVPWSGSDLTEILRQILAAFKVEAYDPPVNHWQHRTRDAWSVQIHRNHLVSNEAPASFRNSAQSAAATIITDLLKNKYTRCRAALEKLTKYGPETADEQTAKETLLSEFWALSRALEGE
jgi:SAM-dependent methyltransferase